MDQNPHHSLSNAARKRRSSILKSHRPPRTPFSELEFNVATPGDSKSRRVSFSRHKDVAEFIKHEATTTWRSIYVEHNKSDSLGNDSDIQSQPQVVVTQNVRIFEQQFEEIETDCIDTNGKPSSRTPFNDFDLTDHLTLEHSAIDSKIVPPTRNFEVSFLSDTRSARLDTEVVLPETSGLNIDFSAIQTIRAPKDDLDEIADDIGQSDVLGSRFRDRNISQYLEVDLDLTHKQSEQSDMSITDTIASPKVSVQAVEEPKMSAANDWTNDKENIVINPYVEINEEENFALNKSPEKVLVFTGKNLKYASIDADLDELEEPIIKANKSNSSMANLLDLDAGNQPSTSNNYGDPSTSANTSRIYEQSNVMEPITNMVEESKNIIHDIVDNLSLRLTDTSEINKSVLNRIPKGPRKTIILNVDDDLPNFISESAPLGLRKSIVDINMSIDEAIGVKKAMHFDDLPVPKQVEARRTILFDSKDSGADISMTQVLPNSLNFPDVVQEKRRTIVFDDDKCDLSITQALPSKIIAEEKQKTIVFEDNVGDLSITQCLHSNVLKEKRKSVVSNDNKADLFMTQYDNMGDLSLTQGLTSNILQEKRKTIVFDDDKGDLSMTQAIPSNINLPQEKIWSNNDVTQENRKTIVFEENEGDLSMTQAIPSNINLPQEKIWSNNDVTQENRKTIVFEENEGGLSMTQAIPSNINIPQEKVRSNNDVTQEKRKTIVFEENEGDLSMTQAIPSNINLPQEKVRSNNNVTQEKRKTIVFEENEGDLSMTQAIPSNINFPQEKIRSNNDVKQDKRKTIVFEENEGDLSMTQAIPSNINFPQEKIRSNKDVKQEKRKTIVFEENEGDLSMTQVIPSNINFTQEKIRSNNDVKQEKRKTIVFEENEGDLSMTQAIPSNINFPQEKIRSNNDVKQEKCKTIVFEENEGDLSMTQVISSNFNLPQEKIRSNNDVKQEKRKTIVFEENEGDLSMTQAIPSDYSLAQEKISNVNIAQEKRRTILIEDNKEDEPITQAIPSKINLAQHEIPSNIDVTREKRRTMHIEDNKGDEPFTQAIPSKINLAQYEIPSNIDVTREKRRTMVFDDDNRDLSMTQVIPSNYSLDQEKISNVNIVQEKRKTIVFDDENGDLSMTQANYCLAQEKLSNIEKYKEDLSITQAILSNINLAENKIPINLNIDFTQEKRKTIVFGDDNGDLSMTQAIPSNYSLAKEKISSVSIAREKLRTIVFDDDNGHLSMIQAIPSHYSLAQEKISSVDIAQENRRTFPMEDNDEDLSMTQEIPSNTNLVQYKTPSNIGISEEKRRTIVFCEDKEDLSMTQAIPSNINLAQKKIPCNSDSNQEIHKTIDFKDAKTVFSMTQATPLNISLVQEKMSNNDGVQEKRRTNVFNEDKGNLSMTEAITSDHVHAQKKISYIVAQEKPGNIVYEDDNRDLFMMQAIPSNINLAQERIPSNIDVTQENRKTIIFEENKGDLAITQAIPSKITLAEEDIISIDFTQVKRETPLFEDDKTDLALVSNTNPGRQSAIHEKSIKDLSMGHTFDNIVTEKNRKTIVSEDDKENLSIPPEMHLNAIIAQKNERPINDDKGKLSMALGLSYNLPHVEQKNIDNEEVEDIFMSQNDMPTISKIGVEDKQTIHCDEIEKLTISLPILPNLNNITMVDQNLKSKSFIDDNHPDNSTEIITKLDVSKKHVSEEMNKAQEELVVYQSITTPSNKTITQSIRKVNEANTSIINQLQENKSKFNLINKKRLEINDCSEANKSTESHKENPVHVIFAVRKDEDIMSSSDQDVSVCVAHVKGNNFNEVNKLSDKSIQKNTRGRSKDLDNTDSLVNRSAQISPRKSLIKEILKLDDVSMEVDFENEITCGTQTDNMKSSDSIIRIIDDDMKDNGIDANQDVELGEISSSNSKVCFHNFNLNNENEEKFNKTSTILEADEAEIKSTKVSLSANNTEYLVDAISEYIDDMYVEKHLNKICNRKSIYDEMKPIFNPRKSVTLTREEMLSNISMARAVLQKSCMNMDNTDENITIEDTPEPVHRSKSSKASYDIVKVLHFNDSSDREESINNNPSIKSASQTNKLRHSKEESRSKSGESSSLKRTTSVETEIKDTNKSYFIPQINQTNQSSICFKEGSTNTGQLSPLKKNTSVETEIKDTNKSYVIPPYLDNVTSNLKEIMNDLVKPMVDVPIQSEEKKETKTVKLQANIHPSSQVDIEPKYKNQVKPSKPSKKVHRKSLSDRTITFDISNPLNNIIIPPIINTEVHKYNPIISNVPESNKNESSSEEEPPFVETRNVLVTTDISNMYVTVSTQSDTDEINKEPLFKEIDTNTIIAMKSNDKLLEERSLTMIENNSPVKEKRKRSFSFKGLLNDHTPKPFKKIQRKSSSPNKRPLGISTVNRLITECYGSLESVKLNMPTETKSVEVSVSIHTATSDNKDEDLNLKKESNKVDSKGLRKNSDVTMLNEKLYFCEGGNDSNPMKSNDGQVEKKVKYCYSPEVKKLEDELKQLPYMGTNLCCWDSCTPDEWSFSLLRKRLKMDIVFKEIKDTENLQTNPERKIKSINVDIFKRDDNPIAYQTVLMAREAIQNYLNKQKIEKADQLPDLIQRITTICWQARRWGQVMESTRLRLAFKFNDAGVISLKVANVALRSIWEVTLNINKETFPVAADMRVTNCLTQETMDQQEIDRIVNKIPQDWGHVPNTLWKVFKYLKNKNSNTGLRLNL